MERFREIVFCDFEFHAPPGEIQTPHCLVAHELHSGNWYRRCADEFEHLSSPPYADGPDVLFVAWYNSAEFGCYHTLGWPLPKHNIDLYAEFRVLTNDHYIVGGNNLLGALNYFGISSIDAAEKKEMRELAIRGAPFTEKEKKHLLEYCESDVLALPKLFNRMKDQIDLPRALFRGEFMKNVSQMEFWGVPVDYEKFQTLRDNWDEVEQKLIDKVNMEFNVFEGRTFKQDRFVAWVEKEGIPWPKTPTGRLSTREDVFSDMAKAYPQVMPLKELMSTLGKMRLKKLAVGSDGRNRCLLSPFKAKTGRNLPSTSRFIFGPARWIRGFIKPPPGKALAYIDWEHQEWGIVGALSQDAKMLSGYSSGDPYMDFAIHAGAAPPGATKKDYPEIRDQFKQCSLAVNYGQGARSLAVNLNSTVTHARELIRHHKRTYSTYWEWAQNVLDHALIERELTATLGWKISVNGNPNPRSLINWPVQSNGSEMLRLAICMAIREGIKVIAPIHDALLIESDLEKIEDDVVRAREIMAEASAKILSGYKLRTEAKIIKYPDRYMDKRGQKTWHMIWQILEDKGN